MTIRVRYAPSPTGLFHVGGARTALYNKLIAEQLGGKFLIRIEDTDQGRYNPDAVSDLLSGLEWLGLDWDEGPGYEELINLGVSDENAKRWSRPSEQPYVQSNRKDIYGKYAHELVGRGLAYPVFTDEEMDLEGTVRFSKLSELHDIGRWREESDFIIERAMQTGRPYYIMLKLPREGNAICNDYLREPIVYPWRREHDIVILKPDGLPTYHMASVIDDHAMQITHVIRGSEWLDSLPIHHYLYEVFGWTEEQPTFIHLPLILNPTGKGKMSKRETRAPDGSVVPVFVNQYKERGFIKEALINFMALTGWHPKSGTAYYREDGIFTWSELVNAFSFDGINLSAATWDYKRLLNLNQRYIQNLSGESFVELAMSFLEKEINNDKTFGIRV